MKSPAVTEGYAAVALRSLESAARAKELSIGIVMPVYNEAAILAGALERLRFAAGGCPVVVADGGSTDGSARIARKVFHTELCAVASRGAQMNRGARCHGVEVLLFLHADCRLPVGFEQHIRRALADPRVAGGCFRLSFDSPRALLRFYCWFTKFPGRFFHFGDQGFFVRCEVFEALGGYAELPFLEDVDFLRRLRRHGRFTVLPMAVTSSARRFLRCGILRQQLKNIFIVALFELGVPARRLARFYDHIR